MATNRNYTEATKSALFALSTNCYYPECREPSVVLFGNNPHKNVQIAHICSISSQKPRYRSMTRAQLNGFSNLILLCNYHHNIVDNKTNEDKYPEKLLLQWKTKAEKDIRAKVTGLDRLTEDRLNQMLSDAAQYTKKEIMSAISELSKMSNSAAELLNTLFHRIEHHYINSESIELLNAASQRLYYLEEGSNLIHAASQQLGNLDSNAPLIASAAYNLAELDIKTLLTISQKLEQFTADYTGMLHSTPEIPDISASIESAGQALVSKIDQRIESIGFDEEPTTIIYDQQRWTFAAWGFVTGVIAVLIIVIILVANNTI